MGKGETVNHNSATGKKENKRKGVVKSADLNLDEDNLESPVVTQKRKGTTAKIITESLDKKASMWKKSKAVDLDKDEDEQENEDVELLAKDIEKKCRILREQLGREFPGKGGQGQGQLQVKIDQLQETVNEKSEEISQLRSKLKHMSEKQEMILSLLLENADEDSRKPKGLSKSKLKLAHLGHMTNLLNVSRASQQQVTISTGIFKERDEFSDKDLRCTKIKTSRSIVLHGLGFSSPLDQDDEFKVSAVVRANNDKLEVGKWTKLIQVKKGEKILLQFDKPIKLKAGKSYEIEYALRGPRLENELSEKMPLTKTQRTNRGRARARGTPVHATEARFNFAAYDKEKYTVSTPAVTFQIRQFKEEKGALCLLDYSVDLSAPPRRKTEKKPRGKDEVDQDDDEDEEEEKEDDDDEDSANGEEQEKNVFVTSERYSESSSDESSSSDDEEKNPVDQTDD